MATIDTSTLRDAARLSGFDFSDADLEAVRAAAERALHALAQLEALPLASVEPVTQFRMV